MNVDRDKVELVHVKRTDRKGFIQFLVEIEKKLNDGYELVKVGPYAPKFHQKAHFKKKGVVLESEKAQKPKPEVTPVPKEEVKGEDSPKPESEGVIDPSLDNLKSKQDLLAFAKENNIEIPESAKVPQAIKKVIKTALENK